MKPLQLRLLGLRISNYRNVRWTRRILSLGFVELRTGRLSSRRKLGLMVSPRPLHEAPRRRYWIIG